MSDLGDTFNALREDSKAKRANNRASSAELLRKAGIAFESRNGGAHLIVSDARVIVDFWPGTGLWISRGGTRRGRGVRKLIRFVIDSRKKGGAR